MELAERPSGAQEIALAQALDDPSLELGYWLDDERAYVDGAGRRLELPGSCLRSYLLCRLCTPFAPDTTSQEWLFDVSLLHHPAIVTARLQC